MKDVGAELGAMIESYGLHQFDRRKLPALMADEYSFLDITDGECQRNPSATAADDLKCSNKPLSCCEHYSVSVSPEPSGDPVSLRLCTEICNAYHRHGLVSGTWLRITV